MNLQDALYNWLTIKKVSDERKDDQAAKDTLDFFEEMLRDDHQVADLQIEKKPPFYHIHFKIDGKDYKKQFPIELIDALYEAIESEPKYN
ncbi:hypothetical protein [Pseudalkalibacillus salsuginis]|uniref:hypothetical protein n=1 Tax=Pseudalkalibacillus salsuginis TaxID=2910972 RepID=UPI001F341780|nr:hypothetical protein [Pseudalkalibacillus salsuginis]MCF6410416.1 hypothetical protein [Pseudalkalibacillus salsuginis]